uniref:Uncharacterized protein n=1 Tax=Romanomermis culicivorax TaxID=13658 RepID=A0A915HT40_ROMCU
MSIVVSLSTIVSSPILVKVLSAVAVASGLVSILVWCTCVVISLETSAKDEMSSSISFKKLFIEVMETVKSVRAEGPVSDDVMTVVDNFGIFKSKIGVSNNASSDGSGAAVDIG